MRPETVAHLFSAGMCLGVAVLTFVLEPKTRLKPDIRLVLALIPGCAALYFACLAFTI
jgi:hypothetical protein